MTEENEIMEIDDNRTIADMSGMQRQPLLVPDFSAISRKRHDNANVKDENPIEIAKDLDREERRAIISGALSAGLLVVGTIAIGFAALILFILKVWG